jgi:cytochrome c553
MKPLSFCLILLMLAALAPGQTPTKPAAAKPAAATPAEPPAAELPDWLYPIDPVYAERQKKRNLPPLPPLDDIELLDVPGSTVKLTAKAIGDNFNAPDWFPGEHGPMPDVVAKGRKPAVIACAFCHTPTGQGRPENSALAGLSENYIREQLKDFRSGKRKPVGPASYLPSRSMHTVAAAMKDAEIDESAKYFSQQKLARRVWVVESLRIPRAEPSDWVYMEVGGTEDLGDRMLEVTNEIQRHQRRDPKLQYTAYVPPGAIGRGKRLVTTGDGGKTVACTSCHGANLKGLNDVPPIAGRSPTYLLRQMLAFKHGLRTSEAGKQMLPTVEKLELNDMIDIVAYVGTLYP